MFPLLQGASLPRLPFGAALSVARGGGGCGSRLPPQPRGRVRVRLPSVAIAVQWRGVSFFCLTGRVRVASWQSGGAPGGGSACVRARVGGRERLYASRAAQWERRVGAEDLCLRPSRIVPGYDIRVVPCGMGALWRLLCPASLPNLWRARTSRTEWCPARGPFGKEMWGAAERGTNPEANGLRNCSEPPPRCGGGTSLSRVGARAHASWGGRSSLHAGPKDTRQGSGPRPLDVSQLYATT